MLPSIVSGPEPKPTRFPSPVSRDQAFEKVHACLNAEAALAPRVTRRRLLLTIALAFQFLPGEIKGRSRDPSLVKARFAFFWFCKHRLMTSLPDMGRRLGGRDHTTALHGVRRADELRRDDCDFARRMDAVEARLWPDGWTAPCAVATTKRLRYATRAFDALAAMSEGVETAAELKGRLGVSINYACNLLADLRMRGLIVAVASDGQAARNGKSRRYRLIDCEPPARGDGGEV